MADEGRQAHADAGARGTRPILAPPGASPARASHPDEKLDERYHIYESNPVPWWIALVWLSFLIFGVTYLILNLLE
jgi:hypothetical protein